jgi:hypothetical protein
VPESNIVCFRVAGADQLEIRDRLLATGRLHIGATVINGERYLRLVVTAPDTDERTLIELLQALRPVQLGRKEQSWSGRRDGGPDHDAIGPIHLSLG